MSGWLVLAVTEKPDWFRSRGIPQPARFRQAHLDWIMMGLILLALSATVPGLPGWIKGLVIAGTIVNPLLFLPLAWGNGVKSNPLYVAVTVASFVALSFGLVAAAVWALT